jgi:hypothetical protein
VVGKTSYVDVLDERNDCGSEHLLKFITFLAV